MITDGVRRRGRLPADGEDRRPFEPRVVDQRVRPPLGTVTGAGDSENPLGTVTGAGDSDNPLETVTGAGDSEAPLGAVTGGGDSENPLATTTGVGEAETPLAAVIGAGDTETPLGTTTGVGDNDSPLAPVGGVVECTRGPGMVPPGSAGLITPPGTTGVVDSGPTPRLTAEPIRPDGPIPVAEVVTVVDVVVAVDTVVWASAGAVTIRATALMIQIFVVMVHSFEPDRSNASATARRLVVGLSAGQRARPSR
jgi:hypothetical protein